LTSSRNVNYAPPCKAGCYGAGTRGVSGFLFGSLNVRLWRTQGTRMTCWIVSSKHSRDEATKDWDSKWTADQFVKSRRFFPSKRKGDFRDGDRCVLKVFGSQDFIADFRIA
jgi:hypothetical protein